MPKITFVEANGTRTVSDARLGETLKDVAVGAGVNGIVAECGGACACGTCHCYLEDLMFDRVAGPEETEQDMLEFVIDPKSTSRLSCQIIVTEEMDNMVVTIPESQT